METLTEDSITFGKYKNKKLIDILRDRQYCQWLLIQDWFMENYEYLYNRVKEYKPILFFIKSETKKEYKSCEEFVELYPYFNFIEPSIVLTEDEKKCFSFYKDTVLALKSKIVENKNDNKFDIKAPSKWLLGFEKGGLSRDVFKEFIERYDLPNITSIVEDIKGQGGIEYKGAKAYLIAKENSRKQEVFWEEKLKKIFGEDIGCQFKFNKCIFDFINISRNILFECKLSLSDFNEEQHKKYLMTLENYTLVYLIGRDIIIVPKHNKVYTIREESIDLENINKFVNTNFILEKVLLLEDGIISMCR